MSQKPSLVASLTPRQILELWSTMDPEARLQLIAQHKLAPISIIEYLPEYADQEAVQADESFFSKFSQVFQAFGKLEAHLDKALEQGNLKDFEYYFLGREVDSLRSFLRSVNQSEHFEKMPVVTYIIGLCARQLQEKYTAPDMAAAESIAAMIDQNQLAYADLLGLVNTLLAVKERLDLSAEMAGKNEPFFSWFEGAFLKHFQPVATK